MTKNTWIMTCIVLVVLAGGAWWMKASKSPAPAGEQGAGNAQTSAESQDSALKELNAIDLGADASADLQPVDNDLNQL